MSEDNSVVSLVTTRYNYMYSCTVITIADFSWDKVQLE